MKANIAAIVSAMTGTPTFVHERTNMANITLDDSTFPLVYYQEFNTGSFNNSQYQITEGLLITMQFLDRYADLADTANTNDTIYEARKTAAKEFIRRFNASGLWERITRWQFSKITE